MPWNAIAALWCVAAAGGPGAAWRRRTVARPGLGASSLAMRRVAPVLIVLALTGCGARARGGADAPTVELDELGGEVWSFAHRVSGRAPEGCVTVEIKRGPVLLRVPAREGRFSAVVPLAPGENVVGAYCADPALDARDARTVYRVRLRAAPRAEARVTSVRGAILLDGAGSAPNEATRLPISEVRWSEDEANPAPLRTTDGRRLDALATPHARLALPERDGEYVAWLEVRDVAGRRDRAGVGFVVEGGRARPLARPSWIDEAVVYGVVPFLFGEPAFDAVRARLPELERLGVTALWLSPIYEAPGDDFGYAVTDYFRVREEWGSMGSFRALVDEAHARGMKVLLDFVPNHSSSEHRYFRHAARFGRRSPYYGLYERDAEGRPTHYFDWEHLPNLDYDDPAVRRWMTEAFAFWTRELDVDGFRVDVAWGVEERAPGFFAELRDELARIEPRVALVAEASARRPTFVEGGFDAAYDWTDEVGQWAWHDVFDGGRADLSALREALRGPGHRVLRFLDNNDTGERFATRHGEGLERVASALLFTVPGIPALFTGQEVGAQYHPYQQLGPLAFTPDPARLAHYRRLVALRRAEPALARGELVPLLAEPSDRVYAYARLPRGEGRPIVVVLGFGERPVEARVRLPAVVRSALRGRTGERLLGSAAAPRRADDVLRVRLGPYDPVVWAFDAPTVPTARSTAGLAAAPIRE